MQVALCVVAKQENLYIKEFIDYYYKLHIDKIFIYDNNNINGEVFDDILKDYIDLGFVTIINKRGKVFQGMKSYQECWKDYHDKFDWICYFDVDEFLILNDKFNNDIHNFLSMPIFNDKEMIHINMIIQRSKNVYRDTSKSIFDIYNESINNDEKTIFEFPINAHIKTIIRGKINKHIYWIMAPHTPVCENIICCNDKGEIIQNNDTTDSISQENAYIKHFTTKSFEDYIDNKILRGYNASVINSENKNSADAIYSLLLYFYINGFENYKIHDLYNIRQLLNTKVFQNPGKIVIQYAGDFGNILYQYVYGKYIEKISGRKFIYYIPYEIYNNNIDYLMDIMRIDFFNNIVIYSKNTLNEVYILIENNNDIILPYEYRDVVNNIILSEDTITSDLILNKIYIDSFKYVPKDFCLQFIKFNKNIQDIISEIYRDINFSEYISISIIFNKFNSVYNYYDIDINWFIDIILSFNNNEKFVITSDDINKCKNIFKEFNNILYIDINYDELHINKDYTDLYIASICKDNIISNSNISWWGAYLNQNKDRKVYFNKNWLKNYDNIKDLIPINDNWYYIDYEK